MERSGSPMRAVEAVVRHTPSREGSYFLLNPITPSTAPRAQQMRDKHL